MSFCAFLTNLLIFWAVRDYQPVGLGYAVVKVATSKLPMDQASIIWQIALVGFCCGTYKDVLLRNTSLAYNKTLFKMSSVKS